MMTDQIPIHSAFIPVLTEQSLHDLIAFLESCREVFGLVTAAFGHVGFAAATTADDRRKLFNDLSGRNLAGEVRGGTNYQRDFSVAASSEHDHARLNPGEQRVRELTHGCGIETARFARQNFHARD